MEIAREYASKIMKKDKKDWNNSLMSYAEEMGKRTGNSYADSKQMIAFYFGIF